MTAQPVLFIGGLGRSGSTLIEKILNEFPDTTAVGETVHLWERGVRDGERCGCGQPFHQCPFWERVGREAFGGWSEIDIDRAIELRWSVDRSRRIPSMIRSRRRGFPNRAQQEYLDLIGNVLLAAGRVGSSGGAPTVLIDSSKHLSAALLYSLDPRIDLRVLHLVRDPRGVAYSWTKSVARPEAGAGSSMGNMPIYQPMRTAARWVTDNLGFAALDRVGVPRLELRYEDFLADPEQSLAQVAEFAGLAGSALPEDVFDGRRGHFAAPMHSAAGNPLRFGAADLVLRLDEAWRSGLSSGQRRLVAILTAPARRRFGY